jgi:hypothetical protein
MRRIGRLASTSRGQAALQLFYQVTFHWETRPEPSGATVESNDRETGGKTAEDNSRVCLSFVATWRESTWGSERHRVCAPTRDGSGRVIASFGATTKLFGQACVRQMRLVQILTLYAATDRHSPYRPWQSTARSKARSFAGVSPFWRHASASWS